MNTIQNLNIGNYLITLDSDAVTRIQNYLNTLKNHYAKIESGQEIYQDIESRIGEIFRNKLKNGQVSIHISDCEEVIQKIGTLADLGIAESQESELSGSGNEYAQFQNPHRDRRLTRNIQDKILTGLGSGIAQYLGIDPLWVRLILICLFASGIGFIIYLIVSLVVPKNYESIYHSKRLMRSTHDKYIGGVCSGFAQYLHIQPLYMRLVFLTPLILSLIGTPFGWGKAIAGLTGTSFIAYILLVIIMPKARTSIDRLQMSGAPVNAKNIQSQFYGEPYVYGGGGDVMKTIIKGILYFILGSILLGICFVCFLILIFGLKALPYANYIIAPGSQSFLGYSAWLLVFCTPILWVLAIIYYRFTQNGNTPSWVHRGGIIFFILGLINSALFSNQMSNEFRYQSVKSLSDTSITLPATDSLIIKAKEDDGWDNYNDFLSLQNDQVRVKICRLKVEPSLDKNYHYRLVATSRGSSPQQAEKNCNEIEYPISSEKNTLVIPQGIALKKGQVWRGQSVQLIISVPEGKYLSFSRNSIVQIPKISWLPNEVRFDYSEMLEDDDWYQMVNGKLINKTNQENDVIEEVTEEIERGNEELRELREERLQELHDAKDQFKNELTHMSDEMRKILGEEKIKKTIDSLDQAIQQIQSEIDSERDKITKELKRKIDEAVQKKKEIESRDTI